MARAATEHVIHNFSNFPSGANPYGTLARDSNGSLYGTTFQGGAWNFGTVFKLDGRGYRILYSFRGGIDGANPYAGVIVDAAGNLYGATYNGGTAGAGVVYKLDPSGVETSLYTFSGGVDGRGPYAGVISDAAGNLYGTTVSGGASNSGVVYKVNPSGQESVLYSFKGTYDGANPYGGVTADAAGNLYGTTHAGGPEAAQGVIYKLDTFGVETVLHTFNGRFGGSPTDGVTFDSAGNLYGTASNVVYELNAAGDYSVLAFFSYVYTSDIASAGVVLDGAGNIYGTTDIPVGFGPSFAPYGAVFKLTPGGRLTSLYNFPGPAKSGNSVATGGNGGVLLDAQGNLYGTTPYENVGGMVYKLDTTGAPTTLYSFPGAPRGTNPGAVTVTPSGALIAATSAGGLANAGVVYSLDVTGAQTVLYSFAGGADGSNPNGGVAVDSAGNLYGVTFHGGTANFGVVYKIDSSGQETVIHSFTGGPDGAFPNGVIVDGAGNLYGTTFGGGTASRTGIPQGVVFKIDASGNETVLHSFTGLADGGGPTAGVVLDAAGNLYGTTNGGGLGAGVVFKIDKTGHETVLYRFTGGADGGNPFAGVILDAEGNLYGTAVNNGAGNGGVVFEIDTTGAYKVLYSFVTGFGGNSPFAGVVRNSAGDLYGTTAYGGLPGCIFGCGVVYRISASGQETVVHSFTGGSDGGPSGSVALGPAGNLYGNAGDGAKDGGLLFKVVF